MLIYSLIKSIPRFGNSLTKRNTRLVFGARIGGEFRSYQAVVENSLPELTTLTNREFTNRSKSEVHRAAIAEHLVHNNTRTEFVVFVSKIPFGVGQSDLNSHFQHIGPIVYSRIFRDLHISRSLTSGLVCFSSADHAVDAILQLNNSVFCGNNISVTASRESIEFELGLIDRVYVTNLAYNVTSVDLLKHFSQVAKVRKATVLIHTTGFSKCCGVVHFYHPYDAQLAVKQLNKSNLLDRQIFVREDVQANKTRFMKENRPNRQIVRRITQDSIRSGKCLFIANLYFLSRPYHILEHFKKEECPVRFVDILTDTHGRSLGNAIIEFEDVEKAQYALNKMNKTILHGRPLYLHPAKPDEDIVKTKTVHYRLTTTATTSTAATTATTTAATAGDPIGHESHSNTSDNVL